MNPGGKVNAEFNDLPITADCNPVFDSIPAKSDNGQEDFMEKIKDIDKGMKSFELSENAVTKANNKTVTPSPNGPNVDPTNVISKPTRWTRVARPSTSQGKSGVVVKLGKHSNTLPAEANPIQKCKTSGEKLDYAYDYPTVEADIQPRREL